MKIAPLYHALAKETWAEPVIVHTGQHYDINMSDVFFQDLMLPSPHIHLGVGSGTHAEQTGKVMIEYEKVLMNENPDLVIVVGDVNSTVAATLAAVKLGIKVAHLEAGLRSFDRSMPEEINRIVTDSVADILWTPSPDGDENLMREGVSKDRVVRVGNIMIDSLEMLRDSVERQCSYQKYKLKPGHYGLVTMHRPSNVDDAETLRCVCEILIRVSENIPVVFPVHPRTRKNMERFGIWDKLSKAAGLIIEVPLGYLQFMSLVFNSRFVLTDSGGIQEETTYLGIPCLTMRPNTERPITIELGTNKLCNVQDIKSMIESVLSQSDSKKNQIEFWDGHTADRVVESIDSLLNGIGVVRKPFL